MIHFRPISLALAVLLPATAHAQSAPAAPTGLAAAPLDAQAALTWDDPSDSTITGYSVRSSTSLPVGGSWTAISGSGATTTSHTVASLTNGTRYYFEIRATNAHGDSGASSTAPIKLAASPAAVVAIIDANLRTKLEMAMGKGAGETITQLDMAKLQGRLDLASFRSEDIAGLSGLAYAINVSDLELSFNSVSDLSPLAGLTGLQELRLTGNQISNLAPLAALTGLQELWLSGNQISDLTALAGLTALTRLGLADNAVADLTPLAGLTGLDGLWLSHNQISNLTALASLTALTGLDLANNAVADLTSLVGLTGLQELRLSGNQISNLTALAGLTVLTELSLRDNAVADLTPLVGLTGLQRLWLSGNQISNLTALAGLTALTALDLGDNAVADLTPLAGLTVLQYLFLEGNEIAGLIPLAGLTSLTNLDLDDNAIVDLTPLSSLTGLRFLTLTSNGISDVTPLGSHTSLIVLGLGNNQISDLTPLGNLTSQPTLQLQLDRNRISDLTPLARLSWLTGTLLLHNNQISDLGPLASLTDLQSLRLDNNRISDVTPLAGLTDLLGLRLDNNRISDVAALAANRGIGYNARLDYSDEVDLRGNPLSRASVYVHIPAMRQRGAAVYFSALPSEPNTAPEAVRGLDDAALVAGGSLAVDLLRAFRDPDGDPLTFSASSSQPAVATARVERNTLTVMTLVEGQARIAVRAADPFGATASLSFLVTVGNPVSIGGGDATNMEVAAASVPEGGVAEIAIAMAEPREEDVSFAYSFGPDSDPATDDADAADHGGEGGTVTIPAGETEATIRIPIADDDDIEPAREAFLVALQPLDGAGLANSSAIVHIEEGVCDRTWQVADALRDGRACEAVTPAELQRRRVVRLTDAGLAELDPLDFHGLAGMRVLILDGNGLSALPEGLLAGSPALRVLRLRGNRFETLPALGSAPALIELDLAGNVLNELPADPFENLPSLGYLYLGGNGIEALPADLLADAEGLRVLELQDNALEALPEGLFAGVPKLFSLQLQGNPGAPFSLPVELARVQAEAEGEGAGQDGEGEEEPGRATIQLRMPHAAPFAISAEISAAGATLSAQTATIAAGDALGEAVSVVRSVAGDEADATATVEITSVPSLPDTACGDDYDEYRCFQGFELTPGIPLTVFEPPASATADVPRMR